MFIPLFTRIDTIVISRLRVLVHFRALLLLSLLACGSEPTAPSLYSVELLAGRWRSSIVCPTSGYIHDYELSSIDSVGRTFVRGREQPRACGSYSVSYPVVFATYDARRSSSVQIESAPRCCTYVTGVATPAVTRIIGQFADSNTLRVTRTVYAGASPVTAPESFTLTRQ